MAGSSIDIAVNDADIQKALEHLHAKLGDLTPVFRDLGEALKISHRERFSRGVGPDGQPWPELSPKYRAHKKKNQDKKLVLNGWLRELHYQAGGTELRLGTDKEYGAIHQFGFSGPQSVKAHTRRGHPVAAHTRQMEIPARPFLGLDETETAHILDVLAEWLAVS